MRLSMRLSRRDAARSGMHTPQAAAVVRAINT
jgi:hypothetical protein